MISKTTPNCSITMNCYIAETICLNLDRKLQPYFWRISVGGKYWSQKFGREVSIGCKRLFNAIGELPDDLHIMALIRAIEYTNVKTLLNLKNVRKVKLRLSIELEYLRQQRKQLAKRIIPTKDYDEYMDINTAQPIAKKNDIMMEDENI